MEITEDRVRHAKIRLDVYRRLRDRCDRIGPNWRMYDAMVRAVEETLGDLGIKVA